MLHIFNKRALTTAVVFSFLLAVAPAYCRGGGMAAAGCRDTAAVEKSGMMSVGVVLSGGGAKGVSHVGVLKALEENNIPIDYICGTSMGAVVAALYATGYTPDEMLEIFGSKVFEAWYKGVHEKEYASYFYNDEPSPSLFSVTLHRVPANSVKYETPYNRKRYRLKVNLPSSIVSPYSMNMAMIEYFTSPSTSVGERFDSLMAPFFCVASDIVRKKPVVLDSGNLGAAVRASMTYPFVFKPIEIDSVLLFDGGFYNNFPWDIMLEKYRPDYIIGAKCVGEESKADQDDIYSQVANMVTMQTDYSIPPDKGIVIGRRYPFGLMEFNRSAEIVKMGYETAQLYISRIKASVQRERTLQELDSLRLAFKGCIKPLKFAHTLEVSENVTSEQSEFIVNSILGDGQEELTLSRLKRRYYNLTSAGLLNTAYLDYETPAADDSLLHLKIHATLNSPWRVSFGGNLSTSSLNQFYLGASYNRLCGKPWKIGSSINLGKYYKGGELMWRQNVGLEPLMYYSLQFTVQQIDYFNGNQKLFKVDRFPSDVKAMEYILRGSFATPVNRSENLMLRATVVAALNRYRYYSNNLFSDLPDRNNLAIISPIIGVERDTRDNPLYPTQGAKEEFYIRYNFAKERLDGSHNQILLKACSQRYFKLLEWFSLGYNADLTVSTENRLADYTSMMLYMPAFKPVPHNNTLMMEHYRANSYFGGGISPVILFTNSLFLHTNISYFQPYKQICREEGGGYVYSKRFPRGAFIANAALVWQSPVGPISLVTTYYQRGEYKWYPQLNIGFLIFKKESLDY